MCYEESKQRYFVKNKPKAFQTNQPLIKDKKYSEVREKENDKYNIEYQNKSKNLSSNDINTTLEFEPNKFANNYLNLPAAYLIADRHNYASNDRYQPTQNNFQQQQTNFQQQQSNFQQQQNHSKNLTFGYVRNNGLKIKETTYADTNLNICQTKKPLQQAKNFNQIEKEKSTNPPERTEKPLIQKIAEKKQKAKQPILNKPVMNNFESDDFACTEELDFKPVVEKKTVVQEKKHTTKFDFTNKIRKPEKKNDMKDLREFEYLEKIVNGNAEAELLQIFCQKQEEYLVNAGYLERNQKNMSWLSRAIVVDWMRQLAYEFRLQRNTFHTAVVLLDNYLEKTSNIPKSSLQAIGATTLFIASKLEEFQCKESAEFAYATNNSCTIQDIHELEIKITKCLRFRLNPPTFYDLANRIMSQWDAFLAQNEYAMQHPAFEAGGKVWFKQLDENSYRVFKEVMQVVDCTVMDIQTSQYKPRMLVCAVLYLLVGRELKIYSREQIASEFPRSSLYLLDDHNDLNSLFRAFVEHIFGFTLFDILPVVQYVATYFDLKITEEKPIINEEQDLEVMSLEEYCSFQTYNTTMIKTVKARNRGLY